MSKYIGFALAFLFLASWLYRKMRPRTVAKIHDIPTGVSRWTYVVVLIMLFIGGAFTPFGVIELSNEIQRNLEWVRSTGFVTELVTDGSNRGRPSYRARFHYRTSPETGAVDHEVLDPNRTQRPPNVADAVDVLYDPSNPDAAVIDRFQTRWFIPLVLVVIGAATLLFSTLMIVQIARLQSLARLVQRRVNSGSGEGKLLKTKKNFLFSYRHNPSWSLVVEYTDLTGRKHLAISEPIWEFHPDTWAKPEIPVPLQIDRGDSSRAWVRVQDYFQMCK